MKVSLTKKELDYLSHAPFWDWKRAELDTRMAELYRKQKMKKADIESCHKVENWYKNLYIKLGGKVK